MFVSRMFISFVFFVCMLNGVYSLECPLTRVEKAIFRKDILRVANLLKPADDITNKGKDFDLVGYLEDEKLAKLNEVVQHSENTLVGFRELDLKIIKACGLEDKYYMHYYFAITSYARALLEICEMCFLEGTCNIDKSEIEQAQKGLVQMREGLESEKSTTADSLKLEDMSNAIKALGQCGKEEEADKLEEFLEEEGAGRNCPRSVYKFNCGCP